MVRLHGRSLTTFKFSDITTSPLLLLLACSCISIIPVLVFTATLSVEALIGPARKQRLKEPSFVGA
jgi:hypothetical protein